MTLASPSLSTIDPSSTPDSGSAPTSASTGAFAALGVPARLTEVLSRLGVVTPTPIQATTLPDALAGRDVLGRGRTGSGKTYAFLLPLVARLSAAAPDRRTARARAPRALILAPTRELAVQIDAALAPLAKAAGLTSRTVFGGVGQGPQVSALRRGVDVLVACPGRLEDLIGQGHCTLGDVQVTVLDEADHMADLGFLPGVRRLLAQTPKRSQRLLFSATLDRAVDALSRQFLTDPVTHVVDTDDDVRPTMTHHVLQIEREHRLAILVDLAGAPGRTVVFTRTKHGAKALTRQLTRAGVAAVELHGTLSQGARTRNLEAFHSSRATALVATDIAARGIHVDDVALVVHADPPSEHKAYLHRSGRTARAGSSGTVVTLATREQAGDVRALTRAAGITPTVTRVDGAGHPVVAGLLGDLPAPAQVAGGTAPSTAASSPVADQASRPARERREGGPARRRRRSRGRRPASQAPAASHPSPSSHSAASSHSAPASHSAASFSARRR